MANVIIDDTYLQDIADSIREKTGSQGGITPSEMSGAVIEIPSGSSYDWEAIGYSEEPDFVGDAYNYAKEIYDNWDSSSTTLAFTNDRELQIMPLIDTSNVTYMDSIFSGCTALKEVPSLNTSNVINFSSAFETCYTLKKIGTLDGSKFGTFSRVFYQCENLEEVTLLNVKTPTTISYLCYNCYKLKQLPEMDTSKATSFSYVFYNCKSIETLPSYNTAKASNFGYMCSGCTSLKNVPVLSFTLATNLGGIFQNCPNLTDESLNNIMQSCINGSRITSSQKTLTSLGLDADQRARCATLSNWTAFTNAGWSA